MASWVGAVDTALSRMTLAYTEDLVEQGRRGAPALLVAVKAHKTRRTNLLTARAILQTMGMVALTLVTTIHVDNLGWPWWGVLLTTIAVVAIVQLLALGISTHLLSGSRYVSLALASSGFACWMMRLRRRSQETVALQAGEEGAERIGESEARLLAADTLREIFDEVSEDGGAASLEEEDRKIIRSVFELGQTRVGEVMVPRSEMVTIRGDESARSALQLFVRSGYSRLPVVGKSLDEIGGFQRSSQHSEFRRGNGGTEVQSRAETRSPRGCRSRIDSSRCRNSCRGVTPYRLSVGEAGRIIDLAQLAEEVFR